MFIALYEFENMRNSIDLNVQLQIAKLGLQAKNRIISLTVSQSLPGPILTN